eukprot:jgi/Hompol1/2162/HPOL_002196-RA
MASKRTKPLLMEEKRKRMTALFHESRDFFNMKELEKIAPRSKGIIEKSVKEVADGLVQTEKIGSGVYYWSFPGSDVHQMRKSLENTVAEIVSIKEISDAVHVRQDTDERKMLLVALEQAEKHRASLVAALDKLKECDPIVIKARERGIVVAREAADRWTDNIFSLQRYCREQYGISASDFNSQFEIPDELDYAAAE